MPKPEKKAACAAEYQGTREEPSRLRHRLQTYRQNAKGNHESNRVSSEFTSAAIPEWNDFAGPKFRIGSRFLHATYT